jgi:hypothetical protein
MKLAIVTASLDTDRAGACMRTWSGTHVRVVYTVLQGYDEDPPRWRIADLDNAQRVGTYFSSEILGVVPAFALGVQKALEDGAEIIACLHDDLEIHDPTWAEKVVNWFETHPTCGLAGFGGATGLGHPQIYQIPYDPMQLARIDFVSNMRDAEAHGRRATTQGDWRWPYAPERVVCLDGFSQIGRREFWQGLGEYIPPTNSYGTIGMSIEGAQTFNLFGVLQSWGVVHHFYDGMLGCFAKRLGWEVWMLPIACHHLGGQTAVGDARYAEWASQHQRTVLDFGNRRVEDARGDQLFWEEAHRIGYEQFRDVLPLRLP